MTTDLLERLDPQARESLLLEVARNGKALGVLVGAVDFALEARKDPSKAPAAFLDLSERLPDELAATMASRLAEAPMEQILSTPEFDYLVHRWKSWGDPNVLRSRFNDIVADDEGLLLLLDRCLRTGTASSGKRSWVTYQLNMGALECLMDLAAEEPRVKELIERQNLSLRQREAVKKFLVGMERIRQGKDPDGSYLDDTLDS